MKSYVVKSKWPLIISFNDRREIITDFKAIRQAENLQAAKERLAAFSAKWESSYKRRIKNLVQMEGTIPCQVDTYKNKNTIFIIRPNRGNIPPRFGHFF